MKQPSFKLINYISSICFMLMLCHQNMLFAENWTRFRGENGAGISKETGFPASWKPEQFKWKVEIPTANYSSPIVWETGVYLVASKVDGSEQYLKRLDLETGKEVWSIAVSMGETHIHKKNCYAAMSPVTDGDMVYATFSDNSQQLLIACTLDGKQVWQKKFSPFISQHGPGASPIVYKDMVILPRDMDAEGENEIVSLNKQTGDIYWRNKRPVNRASYAQPMIYSHKNQPEQLVVIRDCTGLTGIDPVNGKTLWTAGDMLNRTVASPFPVGKYVIGLAGQGGSGSKLVVLEPGDESGSPAKVLYEKTKDLPYVVCPLVVDDLLYLWSDKGVIVCLEFKTGQEVWKQRIGGNYSGSPVYVDGKIFCISEDGELKCIAHAREFKDLGTTSLGEYSQSTPAISQGKMLLRTKTHLICVSK